MTSEQIIDAYNYIKRMGQNIPDDVLEFMKESAIQRLSENRVVVANDRGVVANDNEIIFATDKTIQIIVLGEIVRHGKRADLNHINTSQVTNMSGLFNGSDFNGNISQWDTSNVTDMSGMFWHSKFNGDISGWDVSAVRNARLMFSCSRFSGDISRWAINKCCMTFMFDHSPLATNPPHWYKP